MQRSDRGLSESEAYRRIKKFGKNIIEKRRKRSPFKIFLSQFNSPLILILIAAAIFSIAIGTVPEQDSNIMDGILILLIVFISGLSGFFQDYKAEKTIEALQKIATPQVKVIRSGKEHKISIENLVPGDLIIIEEGDVVPADCILLEAFDLKVDESTLTGESLHILKKKSEKVFKGTFIRSGSAKARVLRTGMETKLGEIAGKIQEIKQEKTRLQKELSVFSKKILYSILGIIFIIFLFSLFKYDLYQSLLVSISLAVAAIPEGLPAVLVLVLAIGAKIMAKKNALVRKLSVVESAGALNVICTDKTGTLTKNEMSVVKIYSNDKEYYPGHINEKTCMSLKMLLRAGILCNNSRVSLTKDNEKIYFGDQTEIALRKLSEQFLRERIEYNKVGEFSFDSERKMMSVVYKKAGSKYVLFSKGAPEILIKKCDRLYINGKIRRLTPSMRNKILEKNKEYSSGALRVIGFAFKEDSKKIAREEGLVWLGLQALIDPPREEVKNAIKECYNAGIRVIMLTGDNPLTALAIAKKVGLKTKGVLTGEDIERLSNKELKHVLEKISVFARVSPFHKLRILEILKKRYQVGMTGDGVNDALALKKADVGISMGIRGTEVAKEASEIILLDDNFASIVSAIKEGRRSFDNIRKFINYLFVSNLAEVGVLFLATLFFSLKNPILLPIQILWINLLTDGFPALALGVDPARPDVMKKPPRKPDEPIINKRLGWVIGLIGIKKIIILLATFVIIKNLFGIGQARTALFTGFILYEFVRIGSIRSQERLGWFSNKWLLVSLLFSILIHLAIIYTSLGSVFKIEALNLYSWAVLATGVIIGYFSAIIISNMVYKKISE